MVDDLVVNLVVMMVAPSEWMMAGRKAAWMAVHLEQKTVDMSVEMKVVMMVELLGQTRVEYSVGMMVVQKAEKMECLKVELTVDWMAVEMVGLKVMMMAGR